MELAQNRFGRKLQQTSFAKRWRLRQRTELTKLSKYWEVIDTQNTKWKNQNIKTFTIDSGIYKNFAKL